MLSQTPLQSMPLLLVALAAIGAGCGDDGDGAASVTPPEGTFVGQVEETNAYIALVSDGERVAR